jgi:hypothetical protein
MQSLKKIIKNTLSILANQLPPQVANNLPLGMRNKKERWSIGIYIESSPLKITDSQKIKNPVISRRNITDVRAGFVADPFMLWVNSTWYMFFEILNQKTQRGEIGLATSQNAVDWAYRQIVLAEPFHLSYPYVFEWKNEYYMIPESAQADAIRLYRASQFPLEWTFIGDIMSGSSFLDSSVFRYADTWWLFTETSSDYRFDTLRLFYSNELLGSWVEHPKSPIVSGNAHIARPGGRVLVMNDKILRYAQDCQPDYGTQVRAFEISELSTTQYYEQEVEEGVVLAPSDSGWNGSGMHHIDPHLMSDGSWIACVDGRVKCKS